MECVLELFLRAYADLGIGYSSTCPNSAPLQMRKISVLKWTKSIFLGLPKNRYLFDYILRLLTQTLKCNDVFQLKKHSRGCLIVLWECLVCDSSGVSPIGSKRSVDKVASVDKTKD